MKSAGEGFATQVNFECNEKKIKYKINLAVFPEYDHKNKSIHLLHKHKIIINIWKFRESFSHFIITNLFITCNRIVTFYHTS